jgi:hypothetical protein
VDSLSRCQPATGGPPPAAAKRPVRSTAGFARSIYTAARTNAECRLYPGVGHTMTSKQLRNIRLFFAQVLEEESRQD